ncbi:MAG: hypothetical protein ABUK01_04460 [Leptospirales bacterium]
MSVTIDKVISELDELALEDKEYVKEVFDKMLIEARRDNIRQRSNEAISSFKNGKSKVGSVKDLMKDLND